MQQPQGKTAPEARQASNPRGTEQPGVRLTSFLRLLPGPETLGVQLAVFLLGIVLAGSVLFLMTALDMAGFAPAAIKQTFSWVVLGFCLVLLLFAAGLWHTINREVLRPLERIRHEVLNEESGPRGLGEVVDTMRELRETVHRTRAELDESARNLRHAEKLALVGELAAGVAHSVRNPMTSVNLRLFSLERSLPLTPGQQEDFAVIADAIRHVDGIVSNFLEFSRRPILKPETVSPSDIVDTALRLVESRLTNLPVTLDVRRKSQLPLVQADTEQLSEALLNVLLNACEAINYSGALTVEELLLDYGQGRFFAGIRVTDTGPGITTEDLDDIFTPFFSTKKQGTGLGLPIAKSVLEEHGGDIEVHTSDKGTSFTLLLPVSFPEPAPLLRLLRLKKPRPDIAAPE